MDCWLVLIGRLSPDAARANLRSRRATGLRRNHLSCKREYVMRKPSRCWLGAVPRYWNIVASCFRFISFAENTSAALAPGAGISQPIFLLFFCFLALEFVYKTLPQIFYSAPKFSGVRKKTGIDLKKAIFQRFQIFNQLPVRILNFWGNVYCGRAWGLS